MFKQLSEVNELIIQNGLDDTAYEQQKGLQVEWVELIEREEIYWREKSRELWLREGDKNKKFFHASTQVKKSLNYVFSIQSSLTREVFSKEEEIQEEGVRFFLKLLSSPVNKSDSALKDVEELLEKIPMLLYQEENDQLLKPFTLEEIKKVVFSLSPDKAPGSDGITSLLFQKCWYFIGFDVLLALEESKKKGTMLK